MLANISDAPSVSGSLNGGLHAPATFFHELLNFISQELPAWGKVSVAVKWGQKCYG